MKESIFSSVVRAFFVSLFKVMGFLLAIIIVIAALSTLNNKVAIEPTNDYSATIVADAEGKRETLSSQPVILKINISGVIGLDGLDQEHIRQLLIESKDGVLKDNPIKAVLLYIQTPGGTVTDADGIYRAIKSYKEQYKIPVYAYVDGMCASGGMYVAASADKVLASDVSIIGSVGVISPSALNFSKLLDKVGVDSLTFYAGKGKDELNPLRPWKEGEGTNYKELIEYYYTEFVNIVTSNRPMVNKAKLVQDYGAKVYPAIQAKEIGYIDEAGMSLRETIGLLAKEASLEEGKYRVVQLSKDTWVSELFKNQLNFFQGKVTHSIDIGSEWDPKLANQFLYMYRP